MTRRPAAVNSGNTCASGLPPAITLYEMEDAARQLKVGRRWLQEFIKAHPYYRIAGRRKVFTAEHIRQLFEALPTKAPKTRVQNGQTLERALEMAESQKRDRSGFVYFIRCGDKVKIGFALNDVGARLKTLQTGSAEPLSLLHYERGSERAERELHRRFAAYRYVREWFRLEGDLADFINQRVQG